MMVFKKAVPRRTFLRGVGSTLALPLLDCMVPALTAAQRTAASPISRLGIVYAPNGIIMEQWTPAADGAAFELTPILEPLAAFRDRMLILTGVDNKAAKMPASLTRNAGPHASCSGAFLTGVYPKPPGKAGMSVDQIAAQELGKQTQFASMEFTLDRGETGAGSDGADTDAYLNSLSWRNATTPLPMENNPRKVFERMFGDSESTDPAERLRRIQQNRSILDSVTEEANRLLGKVGPRDRLKVAEYLEGVRDIERRIQLASAQSRDLPALQRPGGIPGTFDAHAKLMFDLQVIAYQTDMTRVTTFAMAREKSERTYPEIGISEAHHALSHHSGNPRLIALVAQINVYHARMFAYFLDKMSSTPDGDGSLLDHSLILYCSSLSNGSAHDPTNLPLMLVGGSAGRVRGGRHIRYPEAPPVTNLFLTVLDKLNVHIDSFADSTGRLELLSVA